MLLAEIALKERDFETAQKESGEILALNPKDFRARMMLGNALMAQGKSADAEVAFKTLIAENPENPAGYYRLGLLQRSTKDYDGALDSFNAALDLNPMLMDVFTNIVLVHGAKGELDVAMEKCDAQLEKVGDAAVARAIIHNLKGSLFLAQKKTDAAEKAFGTAIQENPDFMPPYYALARIYLSGNQQQKAIDQYTAILEKDPKQAGPHMLLGTIYDMQKQFDMSEKHYRAALEIDPQFAPAANNLAYLLSSREGDIDEALKFAQIAKEKLPDDPSVMDTLGWIYYKKGLYGNAVQEFSDSLEKLPENATVNYHLGAALFKKGDQARAKSSLEKALALDGNFDDADDARRMLSEI